MQHQQPRSPNNIYYNTAHTLSAPWDCRTKHPPGHCTAAAHHPQHVRWPWHFMQEVARSLVHSLPGLAAWRPGLPTNRPKDDIAKPSAIPEEEKVVVQGHKSRPIRDGGGKPSPGRKHPMQRLSPLRHIGATLLAAAKVQGAQTQQAVHELTTGRCDHNTLGFLHHATLSQ